MGSPAPVLLRLALHGRRQWLAMAARTYCRRQLLADAAMAASPIGPSPCAARLTLSALWPLAPHPGTTLRGNRMEKEDAPHHDAVLQHVVVLLIVADRRAFEDQRGHGSGSSAANSS